MNPETLVGQFFLRCAQSPDKPAAYYKHAGEFQPLTWRDLEQRTRAVLGRLIELGTVPGDCVALVSENRWEWLVIDLAIQAIGAIHVPIHAALSPAQTAWQINDCRPRVVLLSSAPQALKLNAVQDQLPPDIKYVACDSCEIEIAGRRVGWLGDLTKATAPPDRRDVEPDAIATIIYTSGTTGEAKGVMLTQRNLVSNALGIFAAFRSAGHDRRLNILPLSHIYARTCDWYVSIIAGSEIAIAESRESVIPDLQLTQPTVVNAVPYFYDKLRRVLEEKGLADRPGTLAGLLGGRIKMCNSGGAALPDHVFDFYTRQGVVLRQGYGLTESSPVITLSTEQVCRRGASGQPIPGVEVAIADDGEVLTRGPHVMAGYYKNPAATAEVIQDGWLHTGDLGRVDEDGFLFITGRKKELIVTSIGKNIAPTLLEGLLTADPLIVQAMIIGDGRNFLAALIVPHTEALAAEAAARQIEFASTAQALKHPAIVAMYEERIRERLSKLAAYEQVRRFILLPRAFAPECGELTAKLSLRREVIAASFAAEIEALYD